MALTIIRKAQNLMNRDLGLLKIFQESKRYRIFLSKKWDENNLAELNTFRVINPTVLA
jgi:hypothetical protein